MNRQLKFKLIFTFILIIAFVFLFPKFFVYADVDVKNIDFKFTCYSPANTNDHSLGAVANGRNITYQDCTVNPKYNWYEYNYNGRNYVVLAAATNELLKSGELSSEGVTEKSYIHYFNYFDTFKFKFADSSFDSEEYYGIVLDSCGASMKVNEGDPQILDVYISGSNADCNNSAINQKKVKITDSNGVYGADAGTSSKAKKRALLLEGLKWIFVGLSNGVNMLMDYTATEGETGIKLTYDKDDITSDKNLKDEINVGDPIKKENIDTSKVKNIIKIANISSTIDNRKGEKESVYTEKTKIPVIPVDPYSLTCGKFEIFDIDFFNTNSENKNSAWKGFRDLVASISHAAMYIAAVLLLTMLIWRSVLFVQSSLSGKPKGAYESRTIMDNAVKSIVVMGTIYAIMVLILYLYNNLLGIALNGNDNIYLIKASVEKVYSFNTNFTGYIKYMTMTTNSIGGLVYGIAYACVTILNILTFVGMFARMVIVGAMIGVAPITAVYTMQGKSVGDKPKLTNVFIFEYFIKFYFILVFAPLIVVVLYRFILNLV